MLFGTRNKDLVQTSFFQSLIKRNDTTSISTTLLFLNFFSNQKGMVNWMNNEIKFEKEKGQTEITTSVDEEIMRTKPNHIESANFLVIPSYFLVPFPLFFG